MPYAEIVDIVSSLKDDWGAIRQYTESPHANNRISFVESML